MASIALGVMGALGAAGSIGSAAIGANAAGNAAATQSAAAQQIIGEANTAATTAQGDVNSATGTANTTIGNSLQSQEAALAPYVQAGQLSLSQVQQLLGPNGPLAGPQNQFSFNPTTSPQLQFEQQQANQGLMRNAAATGTALSGGTIRASDALNTGLASTYMNQAFNQQLSTYNTNRQNVLTQLQGLTGLTGLGFNATGAENQDIGTAGMAQAQNTIGAGTYSGNVGLQAAQIGANAISGAANANSAAQLAQGNAWGGLAQNLGGSAAGLYGLAQSPQGFGTPTPASPPLDTSLANDPSLFTPNYGSSGGTGGYV